MEITNECKINEEQAVKNFDTIVREGKTTRYRSWKKCYDFYTNLHNKNYHHFSELQETEKDLAVLNLGFYLASWGMYRGSSFITQYDSSIYEGMIDILLSKEYDLLWDLSFDKLKEKTDEIADKLYGIRNKLNDYLKPYKSIIKVTKNDVSKTLITKILLGTIGCCPAYDRYFTSAIEDGCTNFSNKKNIKNLLDFIIKNQVFEDLEKEYKDYPLMKIVDMAYFTMGLYNDAITLEYFKPLIEKKYLDNFNCSKNDNLISNKFLNEVKNVENILNNKTNNSLFILAVYEYLEEKYNLENNYQISIDYASQNYVNQFNVIETYAMLWNACCLREELYNDMIKSGTIGKLLNRLNILLNKNEN